jgi:hypothetical protein
MRVNIFSDLKVVKRSSSDGRYKHAATESHKLYCVLYIDTDAVL